MIKRFEIEYETKLLKAISVIFSEIKDEKMSEEQAVKMKEVCVMDSPNVCLIQGKTEEAKRILSRFKETEGKEIKIPSLTYTSKEESIARFNTTYLRDIIKIFNCFGDESVDIKMRHDYPATFENDHFKLVLAPRITND